MIGHIFMFLDSLITRTLIEVQKLIFMDLFYCSCTIKYCYMQNALQRKINFFLK